MKTLAGLLGVLALTFSSLAAAASPTPLRIGEQRKFDLHLDARAVGQRYEVRTVDAAFIKLHFDQFSLPEGVTLEVSSPDGQQVYRYSRQQRDGHTVDAAMGQDGRHSFSAMSIHGPVAVLRLLGNAQAPWTEKDGVRISRYLEGFPERDLPQLQAAGLLAGDVGIQSICGSNDKQPAACYASSDAAAFDRSRPVARLVMSGGGCARPGGSGQTTACSPIIIAWPAPVPWPRQKSGSITSWQVVVAARQRPPKSPVIKCWPPTARSITRCLQ